MKYLLSIATVLFLAVQVTHAANAGLKGAFGDDNVSFQFETADWILPEGHCSNCLKSFSGEIDLGESGYILFDEDDVNFFIAYYGGIVEFLDVDMYMGTYFGDLTYRASGFSVDERGSWMLDIVIEEWNGNLSLDFGGKGSFYFEEVPTNSTILFFISGSVMMGVLILFRAWRDQKYGYLIRSNR